MQGRENSTGDILSSPLDRAGLISLGSNLSYKMIQSRKQMNTTMERAAVFIRSVAWLYNNINEQHLIAFPAIIMKKLFFFFFNDHFKHK